MEIQTKEKCDLPSAIAIYYKQKDCFIATAAFGTPFAEEVELLRAYKDLRLSKTFFGAKFISFYYYISPPIAKFISRRNNLRLLVRVALKPIILAVKITHKK